jgi:prepilin-type N-terminal cleavage/methylation domain-containing protein
MKKILFKLFGGSVRRARAAFTLIEMLIVVVIIGILVGIGVPALLKALDNSRKSKIDSVLSNIATAKNRFALDKTTAQVNAWNAADLDDQFTALAPYIVVQGKTGSTLTIEAFIKGTGKASEDLDLGTIATFDSNGNPVTPGTDPSL